MARAEIVLQNDGLAPPADGAIQAGFEATDIGGAIFQLPQGVDAFKINRVQVLFLSTEESALHTFASVHLYCGSLPDPGPPIRTAGGVGLNPGFLNEIDVSFENWIVRRSDGPFVIGVEYLWAVGGPIDATTGHLVADNDGCQSGKNLAYDSATQTWIDPCLAGAPGDFVIRVAGEPFASKAPFGDYDGDGDVDMDDFGHFQRCYTGPFLPATAQCLEVFDCNRDGRIDHLDFEQFLACATRSHVNATPTCGDCLPSTVCPNSLLALLLSRGENPQPQLAWVWIILAIAALLALIAGIRGCHTQAQLTAARNAFISSARTAHPDELEKVRLAISTLRNTWGLTDPEAKRCGDFLHDSAYGTDCCLIQIVPPAQNQTNLIAVQPAGTPLIIIDERYLTHLFSVDGLALILYAEWCHIDDPGFGKEKDQQQRLDAFRQRHGLQNVLPEMKHGGSEGAPN